MTSYLLDKMSEKLLKKQLCNGLHISGFHNLGALPSYIYSTNYARPLLAISTILNISTQIKATDDIVNADLLYHVVRELMEFAYVLFVDMSLMNRNKSSHLCRLFSKIN